MEDWTHKHHRQGLFSSNSNDFSPWIFCTQSLQCLLDPSNSCLSQWSFDQIFWFVVSKKAIWFVAFFGPSAPCFHVTKATKQWRIPAFQLPYQKLEVPESCSMLHQLIMVASCLQEIELWYPSFESQTIDCDLGCFIQRLLQVNEELSRLTF